jgi:hypothetical protein
MGGGFRQGFCVLPRTFRGLSGCVIAITLAGCASELRPAAARRTTPRSDSAAVFDAGLAGSASAFEAYTRRRRGHRRRLFGARRDRFGLMPGAGYDPRQLETA